MRPPRATYRVQFTPDFGWKRLEEILPYLSDLGVSDIYASPIFKPRKGSTHGYDVVDPNRLNPELGTEAEFYQLLTAVKEAGMFWIQDIVPNHMAFDSANTMLMNVFEMGESSPFYRVFDIDWEHTFENLRGKVMAPFLGKLYGKCLEEGELKLVFEQGTFFVTYFQLKYPLKATSYAVILEHNLVQLESELGKNNSQFTNFLGILFSFKNIDLSRKDPAVGQQISLAKTTFARLCDETPEIRKFIEDNLKFFNGQVGEPASFDALDRILSDQYFRLSFWKCAESEINYRRFFNINELISVRVEDPEALGATHEFLFRLLKDGLFAGVRIDHIDGLSDPETYLALLRSISAEICVFVEKILEESEKLPFSWPVQGTTGYEALNAINQVYCPNANAAEFQRIYQAFSSAVSLPEELYLDKQRLIIRRHLRGNIDNLALYVKKVASNDRYGRDLTLDSLRRALIEVLTFFPVYRSYINRWKVGEEDRRNINLAVDRSLEKQPDLLYELEFFRKFFLLQSGEHQAEDDKKEWLSLVMQLQQYTGPLMAKGVEDTFFYVYNRLISLNEVGGNPIRFGLPLEEFHRFFQQRRAHFPFSMNSSETHDTKRGEDARARINVLSEIPREWDELLAVWSRLNSCKKTVVNGVSAPDGNDEYLIYQTLIGAMPFSGPDAQFTTRVKDYLIKAIREAKVHTDWVQQNPEYEKACHTFIEGLFGAAGDQLDEEFPRSFISFQQRIFLLGAYNSLSQTLLKMTIPGTPDFYQGSELWDLSLVDPDNRRPVDFGIRRAALDEVKRKFESEGAGFLGSLLKNPSDGAAKLFLILRGLKARRDYCSLFEEGDYQQLLAKGELSDCVIAFSRSVARRRLLVIAPRFFTRLGNGVSLPVGPEIWKDTEIEIGKVSSVTFTDAITGRSMTGTERMRLAEILRDFPVAILVAET